MRILTDIRKYNPDVLFLLENVEMGAKWERVLSEAIGIYGVHINSALVSAQNRKRIYWTNIRVRGEGFFGELHSDIPQPIDRGILLKDILEDEVDEKYYLSDAGLSGMLKHQERHKSSGNGFGVQFISGESEKSNTLLQRYYKDCKDNAVCIYQIPRGYNNGGFHASKSPTVGASSWENNNLVMRLNERQKRNFKTGDEKANAFLSTSWKGSQANGMALTGETRVRRLTPTECERLQTVEDNFTSCVSDTQRYKMLGNGWTVDVIAHIFKHLQI